MNSSITIFSLILIVFASNLYKAEAEADQKSFCSSLAGHCDRPSVKKHCPDICGGGGGENNNGGEATQPHTNHHTQPTQATTRANQQHSGHTCDKLSPCVPMDQANENFQQRCRDRQLPQGCVDNCLYDKSGKELKDAFLKKVCPLPNLRPYLKAAANEKDNTYCCEKMNVQPKGKPEGLCHPFCNPNGQVWPGKNEALKYAPCVSVLDGIQKCHYFSEGTS